MSGCRDMIVTSLEWVAIMSKSQAGFTLIELIAVIVIIGILAAAALPKFVDLSSDARQAKVNAALGAMKSAAAMTHGKFLIDPNTNPQVFEGVSVTFVNGYPSAGSIAAVAGLEASDFTISVSGSTATVSVMANCLATYTEASSTILPPAYGTDFSGCP
jgi:MSHA pilin protein MshA